MNDLIPRSPVEGMTALLLIGGLFLFAVISPYLLIAVLFGIIFLLLKFRNDNELVKPTESFSELVAAAKLVKDRKKQELIESVIERLKKKLPASIAAGNRSTEVWGLHKDIFTCSNEEFISKEIGLGRCTSRGLNPIFGYAVKVYHE